VSFRLHIPIQNIAAQDHSTPFTDSGSDKKDEDWLTVYPGESINGIYQLLHPSPLDKFQAERNVA